MPEPVEQSADAIINANTDDPHDPATVDTGTLNEIKLTDFSQFKAARSEGGKNEQTKSKAEATKESGQEGEELSKEDETGKEQDNEGTKANGHELSAEDLDKTEPLQTQQNKKTVVSRDYSIFDPADVDDFKKMGNKAFDKVIKIYKENKELKAKPPTVENKTGLPDNYYSHPEAYVLMPEYREASQIVSLAEQIQAHWEEQEFNLRTNSKVKDLSYKDGQLIVGEERDATAKDAPQLGRLLMKSRQNTLDAQSKLNSITNTFKDKYEDDVGVIKDTESKYFPDYDKADHPTQVLQKEILNALPPSLRNTPLATIFAKTGAYSALLLNENKSLRKQLATKTSLNTDVQNSQPKKGSFVAGGRNIPTIDMNLFKNARAEG